MGNIRVLDGHIADQIAAGEVVERPASVVKELVENAVDAGASQVDVAAEEGGLTLLRVTDNGSGMDKDDLRLSFSRHATSKIRTGKDLFHIRTLGFRGEALASIAAVARVTCVTTDREDGLGWKLVMEGGEETSFTETAAPLGTDLTVRDLFFNTPARLKYMKTIQTEMSHISDFMYRLALARPDIAFTLRHNGNLLLQTTGNGQLQQVIAAVYGRNAARQMMPLEADNPDYDLRGWISRPELSRSSRQAMTLVVNGRYIRHFGLNRAIQQAYHTLLPIHRFPLVVLHLAMDPSLLDVNVHPAKLEVRFSKERELLAFVEAAIRNTLREQTLIPDQREKTRPTVREQVVQERMPLFGGTGGQGDGENPFGKPAPAASAGGKSQHVTPKDGESPFGRPAPAASAGGISQHVTPRDGDAAADKRPRELAGNRQLPARPRIGGGKAAAPPTRTEVPPGYAVKLYEPPDGHEWDEAAPRFPELHPVGQVHGTYIVAQNEEGLYLIDQHAAHERINYERFLAWFGQPEQASQETLVPLTLDFTAADAAIIRQRLPVFAQAGVHLEPFGGASFIVRSYPHWFPKDEERQVIEEMAEWILAEKEAIDIGKVREKSAILSACRKSRKANESLSIPEMEALIRRLAACASPFTCPHGRPIIVRFTTRELEKMFKRVM